MADDKSSFWKQVVPGFRVRIIPVLGTIPAIFGQVMASYVVTQIAGMLFQTEPVVNLDVEHYGILHQRLIEREELLCGSAEAVEVFHSTIELSFALRVGPLIFYWLFCIQCHKLFPLVVHV